MSQTSAASTAPDLGKRFKLVDFIPSFTTAVILLALAVGTDFLAPSQSASPSGAASQWWSVGIVIGASTVVAVILRPFQIRLVRTLEGYWPTRRVTSFLYDMGVERHRSRRAFLERRRNDAAQRGASRAKEERGAWSADQLRRYPEEHRLLPTLLGNALRAAEDRAGGRYGMDFSWALPRLYGFASAPLKEEYDNAVDQYDSSARLAVSLTVASAAAAAILASRGSWWTLLSLAGFALAWLAYRGAVEAASHYGEFLVALFDLHRFDLLQQMRVELPETPSRERALNEDLNAFFATARPDARFPTESYHHSRPHQATERN